MCKMASRLGCGSENLKIKSHQECGSMDAKFNEHFLSSTSLRSLSIESQYLLNM